MKNIVADKVDKLHFLADSECLSQAFIEGVADILSSFRNPQLGTFL